MLERKNVECGLGIFDRMVKDVIYNAYKGNYIAVFKFNGVELEAHPESYINDLWKIYMLSRHKV